MKKQIVFLLLAVTFCLAAMAQVIIPAPASPEVDLPSVIISLIPVKHQATVFLVVTILWIISEALGSIKSIKANSTIQLVSGWIKSLFMASKSKK